MPTAVAATLLAGFFGLACSNSGLMASTADAGPPSVGQGGSTINSVGTGGAGGAIGPVGGGGVSTGGTIGFGRVMGRNGGAVVSGGGCGILCTGSTNYNPWCGNGVLDPREECDDGNAKNGDGCSSLCQIEINYVCPSPGQPCIDTAVCGNGIWTPDEACDDGNTVSGDGCSGDCQTIEPGWHCPIPGKPCSQICSSSQLDGSVPCSDANDLVDRCGDGIVTAGEECDCGDGMVAVPAGCLGPNGDYAYGGCTTKCTRGRRCGDGIIDTNFNESCDLGNLNGVCLDDQTETPQDAGEGSPEDAGCPLGSFDWSGTPVCNCPSGSMVLCTTSCQYPVYLP
jgi:cysteine-rich repeat protein